MTNFKQSLLDATMVNHSERMRQRAGILADTLDLSLADARILVEAVDTALIGSIVAMGDAIDSLSPRIQGEGMAVILDIMPQTLGSLNTMITALVVGMGGPTPGCDCTSCKQKKILGEGCAAVEVAVAEALGSE